MVRIIVEAKREGQDDRRPGDLSHGHLSLSVLALFWACFRHALGRKRLTCAHLVNKFDAARHLPPSAIIELVDQITKQIYVQLEVLHE
jgi:hypothetical protein